MKRIYLIQKLIIVTVLFSMNISIKALLPLDSPILINSISGQIWDPQRRPVGEIYVELLNSNFSTVARYRTDGSVRFQFSGINSGTYKVKVLTYGTNYLEQEKDVQIINVFRGSSDQVYVDFYLKYDPKKINIGSGGAPQQVFIQDGIDDKAVKHFKKGKKLLDDNKIEGFQELENALAISPNYYEALDLIGNQYVKRQEYEKSFPYLIKAIDINQRSFTSFYALGYACYQTNKISEALIAAKAATTINANSINAQLLYGAILRANGNYADSEQKLLKAKELSKEPLSEIHWELALLYNKLGRNKEAANELELFLKIKPNTPDKQEIEVLIIKLRKV